MAGAWQASGPDGAAATATGPGGVGGGDTARRADLLAGAARRAAAAVARFGWPRQRVEAWRYTSLRGLRDLDPAPLAATAPAGPADAEAARAADPDTYAHPWRDLPVLASLRGGRLTSGGGEFDGLGVEALGAALLRDAADLPFGIAAVDGEAQAVVARNAALFVDGLPADRGVALRISGAHAAPLRLRIAPAADARVCVEVAAGASVTLVELHSGAGDLHLPVCELRLGAGASLRHLVVADTAAGCHHLQTIAVEVGRDARYALDAVLLGGALTRVAVNVELRGDGAQCALRGLASAAGRQHHDVHIEVDHRGRHTESRQLIKCLVDDAASSVVRGNVRIHRGAQFATAHQLLRNLLLAAAARASSKPQLEIDDEAVRATHGSTTGELDAGQLFYLQTRGLDLAAARALLIGAYAEEIVGALPDAGVQAALRAARAGRIGAPALEPDAAAMGLGALQ